MNWILSRICLLGVMAGLLVQPVSASDPQTIGQLHPPVVASLGDQKITVFFLKNNLKGHVTGVHVPGAEIFYSPVNAKTPTLNYVWKLEGEEVVSVFFYVRKQPELAGKSMYVLTKSKRSYGGFEGYDYSVIELPLRKSGDELSLHFFRGDPPDPELQNCHDGTDPETGQKVVCAYKDAASVKKRLAELDGGASQDQKQQDGLSRETPDAAGGTANTACPSSEFSAFLTAFSERAEVQKAFAQQPLQLVTTVPGDPEPGLEKRSVSGDQIKFPLIPGREKRDADGLTLTVKEVQGNSATAILQKPDTDYVFEYRFVRGACWVLEEVSDFSL
ncbi:hypothetical protein [Pseudomonas sp. R16(2017)]|uniref:hypothetical protein n=1 Tax=Pseudomonas sp. R16(2017) TaxID=1981704 RepID=UPI0021142DC0|nr:hypothetical protein [Pseudomonas sp. R16(2017)]